MKPEIAARILLEDLYGVSKEFGGQPLVNLTLRAQERGINDPEVLSQAVALMRHKAWIELPLSTPSVGFYAKLSGQGLAVAREGRGASPELS